MEKASLTIFVIGTNVGFILCFIILSYYKNSCFVPSHQPTRLTNLEAIRTMEPQTQQESNFSDIRVLIWVMTSPANIHQKAMRVKRTWGARADKLVFISSQDDKDLPAVGVDTEEGRDHLTAKTMLGFQYVYDNFMNDYDWFMKADDDTYVIIENLKYFLSDKDTQVPVYYGHWFKTYMKQGYYSGGGGYVLSKEALRRFGQRGKRCVRDGANEDLFFGACMQELGISTADSRDSLGRSRFHCMDPARHIAGAYPDWYRRYDMFGARKGAESLSDYAISFHYVNPNMMLQLEYYVYQLKPYGRSYLQLQDINKRPPKRNSTA